MRRHPYRFDRFAGLFDDRLVGTADPGRLSFDDPPNAARRFFEFMGKAAAVVLTCGAVLLIILGFFF